MPSSGGKAMMTDRLRDLIAYVVAVAMLLAGSYVAARLDLAVIAKLRPHTATADAVGAERGATRPAR
jgi:hypothetical protein